MGRHALLSAESRLLLAVDWETRSQNEWARYFGVSSNTVNRAARELGLVRPAKRKLALCSLGVRFDYTRPVIQFQRCQGVCGQRYQVSESPHVCNGSTVPFLPWETK